MKRNSQKEGHSGETAKGVLALASLPWPRSVLAISSVILNAAMIMTASRLIAAGSAEPKAVGSAGAFP